ncbi:MAG: hypothetical protein WCP93_03620, partial [Candidatus Berkelbacteria bacterium]
MSQGEGQLYPAPVNRRVEELDTRLAQLQKSTRGSFRAMVGPHDLLRQKFRWYYNWHMNSWANIVHWAVLSGYTVAAFVLVFTLVTKAPSHYAQAASKQAWSSSEEWKTWKLENLDVTDGGLTLASNVVKSFSFKRLAQADLVPVSTDSTAPAASDKVDTTTTDQTKVDSTKDTTTVAPDTTVVAPAPAADTASVTEVKPVTTPIEAVTTQKPTDAEANAPPAETKTEYARTGSATITFDPQGSEIVDWLSFDASEDLNGGSIKKEFSTDNILWTEDAKDLADSDKIYIRLNFSTNDLTKSPVLKTFAVNYSRLPIAPTDLKVSEHVGAIGYSQVLSAGIFSDPDNDLHGASQWQVTNKSGEYTATIADSGTDTKNLTSYTIDRKLADGAYYFRVRYQDSVGAWSPWSAECGFTVAAKEVTVVGGDQIKKNKDEIVTDRTVSSKTISNGGGKMTLESYSGIIHYKEDYKDSKAQWKDINPSHYVDFPDFVLYDQMPSTVKVYKNKIGYEIQSRETGEKYTVELQDVDGAPQLSSAKGTNGLVSWADINNPVEKMKQQNKYFAQFINPALAQEATPNTDNGNLKFEFQISENGVRLWKTIEGPDAPRNFKWKVTRTGSGDALKFRDTPDAFQVENGAVQEDQKVVIDAKKIDGTKNDFIWQETAPSSDLKIDTDVTYFPQESGTSGAKTTDGVISWFTGRGVTW